MTDILPVFQEISFEFIDGVPPHIEAYPSIPSYIGMYSVIGMIDGTKSYSLALDIEDEDTAELLARAREIKQEETIMRYGYSDDVLIVRPDGSLQRTYYGRTL
jgi:hypothetical protein